MTLRNGIRDPSTGDFYPINKRKDLTLPMVQSALKRNHGGSRLCCGCGLHVNVPRRLIPVRISDDPEEYAVRRDRIDEHLIGCIFGRGSDLADVKHLRASSILGPIIPKCDLPGPAGHTDPEIGRDEYEIFAEYAGRILSGGLGDAYIAKNTGRGRHVNATAQESLCAIGGAVGRFCFTNGQNGYVAATRMHAQLRFGLIFDVVAVDGAPKEAIEVYWWEGDRFSVGLAGVDPLAMFTAVKALKTMDGGHRAPPYFIMAVQNTRGWLQRICFHQVAAAEDHLVPTDSGAETAAVEKFLLRGLALIKPMRFDDMERILAAFSVELVGDAHWGYRPDFLALWRNRAGWTLHIRELRGYEKGLKPDYDTHLQIKKTYYERLHFTIEHQYREIDGTELRWTTPTVGPESWTSTYVVSEAPTSGLFE